MYNKKYHGAIGRNKNIYSILNTVAEMEEISANDIAKITHLSVATVSRGLNYLKAEGVIESTGKEKTDYGRYPEIISLNSKYGYYLHFYLRTENVKAYLLDFCGNVLVSEKLRITREIKATDFVRLLRDIAKILLNQRKISYESLVAVSIAIPGLVDDASKVIKRIPNFVNFNNVNLFECAQRELELPVIINNRARLCAVGEFINSGQKNSNIVYIDFTNYSGIGAGIVLNGKLYTGNDGFAGEIGDLLVDVKDVDNEFFDDTGCLEMQAGVAFLYEQINSVINKGGALKLKEILSTSGNHELTLDKIGLAVMNDDKDVTDIVDNVVKKWSYAIINLAVILNPDTIILGGVLDERHTFILDKIKNIISKILFYDVNVRLREIDSDTQVLGGAHMLKKYYLNHVVFNTIFNHLKDQ